jgi:hypothetical protein
MEELTIVRENLMNEPNYSGYCGNNIARHRKGGCDNPRTKWNPLLNQFVCTRCGWTSQYPEDFIKRYKEKWNK